MNEETWDQSRPDMAERLSSRLNSLPAGLSEALGGLPELTTADFAAAVGALSNQMEQLVLGARYACWPSSYEQLREAALRRCWRMWGEKKRKGNLSGPLNEKIVDLVLFDWCLTNTEREAIADTYRAKKLGVGYRRYKNELENHKKDLVAWLDMITAEALIHVGAKLRK